MVKIKTEARDRGYGINEFLEVRRDYFETETEYRYIEGLKLWVNKRGEVRLYDEYTSGLVSEDLNDCDDREILYFIIDFYNMYYREMFNEYAYENDEEGIKHDIRVERAVELVEAAIDNFFKINSV